MNKQKLLISIIVGLALCASAGCSRFFPCCPPANTLLTQSEAESISGVKLKLSDEIRDSKKSSCSYVNGKTGADLHWVGLDLHRIKDRDGPANEAAHRALFAKYYFEVESVTGLGDSAFISQDGNEVFLYARKGTLGLQFRAKSVLPPREAREKFLAIAHLVMARLE